MGSKTRAPVQQDFAADELETMSTRIAIADKEEMNRKYNPLLREMRDKAATEDVESTFTGRANADYNQAMGKDLDISMARSIGQSADRAGAAVANMLGATTQAYTAKRGEQAGVLAAARGQEANTSTALGQAARVQMAENVNKATNENKIRMAKRKALFDVGIAAGSKLAGLGDTTQQMGSTDLDKLPKQDQIQAVNNPFGGNFNLSNIDFTRNA